MTATSTQDVAATVAQVNALYEAGAGVVRIAVDSTKDAEALADIRRETSANLAVDLQENYRLASVVAPHVDKIRYNPGHLYHHEREKPWQEKVRFVAGVAAENDCAMRVGVNCGSVDPAKAEAYDKADSITPMLESAFEHCALLDSIDFTRYCVSLKDSDPTKVIEVNRRFAEARPEVPLHLGVTEAGMPPDGVIKTRIAMEQLISRGIGDTIRVSLTVSNPRKPEEIEAGRQILEDISAGRVRSVVDYGLSTMNIISCPSCSRVENEAFIELAEQVKEMTRYAEDHAITIAVMGCRVNGAGRDGRCRSGTVVRPESCESETRRNTGGHLCIRRDLASAKAGTRRNYRQKKLKVGWVPAPYHLNIDLLRYLRKRLDRSPVSDSVTIHRAARVPKPPS